MRIEEAKDAIADLHSDTHSSFVPLQIEERAIKKKQLNSKGPSALITYHHAKDTSASGGSLNIRYPGNYLLARVHQDQHPYKLLGRHLLIIILLLEGVLN